MIVCVVLGSLLSSMVSGVILDTSRATRREGVRLETAGARAPSGATRTGHMLAHRQTVPPRPRPSCLAYPFFLPGRVFAWVKKNLPEAKQQGAESAEQHRRKHNDAKAHTGNQVYSCGSLAPKLRKGGCSDCEVCVC